MRIRTYRSGDIPILVHVQHIAAAFDGLEPLNEADFATLLDRSFTRRGYNVFLLTDDDDEQNTWGQGESLEGVEGEVVGYTILQMSASEEAYHFRCHGTILPEYRSRGAGHGLILCALNHARLQSLDFVAQARQQGTPIYFEVPLPANHGGAERLASDFELEKSATLVPERLLLYRTEL
jgi:GNAT superfamily N-acetyltransferase